MIRNDGKKAESLEGYETANGVLEEMFKTRPERPRIREGLFVQRYLPLLHGDIEVKEDEYPLLLWLEVSGTPFNEVSVVDDTTGDELFIVPPLGRLYDPEDRNSSMFEVMSEAFKHENAIPQAGLRYLRNFTSAEFHRSPESDKYYKQMADIFKRYGLKPLVEEKTEDGKGNDDFSDPSDLGIEL